MDIATKANISFIAKQYSIGLGTNERSVSALLLKEIDRDFSMMGIKTSNDFKSKNFMGFAKQAISYSKLTMIRLELSNNLLGPSGYVFLAT